VSQAVSAPPKSSGYVNVGALDMYYERHGDGPPLVLLHGAFGTIESCFAGLLPVLPVELQGHGHTRDVARPLSYEGMAGDTAALLEVLDIARAHCVGYSMGGAVALQLALDRPELVDHAGHNLHQIPQPAADGHHALDIVAASHGRPIVPVRLPGKGRPRVPGRRESDSPTEPLVAGPGKSSWPTG
jgi:hypothetical protein